MSKQSDDRRQAVNTTVIAIDPSESAVVFTPGEDGGYHVRLLIPSSEQHSENGLSAAALMAAATFNAIIDNDELRTQIVEHMICEASQMEENNGKTKS